MLKIAARVRLCRTLSGFFVTDNDTMLQYHNQEVWLSVAVGGGVFEAIEGVGHEGLRYGVGGCRGEERTSDFRMQISDCPSTPWAQSCVAQSEI